MGVVMNGNERPALLGSVLAARNGEPLVLRSVRALGAVTGLLFELSVEQRYVNPGKKNVEAVYTFPLPFGAVLLGMEFVLGEKTLSAVVVAKAQAEDKWSAIRFSAIN